MSLAPIRLSFNAVVNSRRHIAAVTLKALVAGATSDAGIATLQPYVPLAGVLAAGGSPFRGARVIGTHSFALRTDGSLWGWGWGQSGQLGNGMQGGNYMVSSPGPVGGTNWQRVAVGGEE